MSSHYYCCNCGNVGIPVSEVEAMYPQMSEQLPYAPFESVYPLGPLIKKEDPSQTTDQTWVTHPGPQFSEIQFNPLQVDAPFLQPQTVLTGPLWPLHDEELATFHTPNQTSAIQPFPEQPTQYGNNAIPASSQVGTPIGPSVSTARRRKPSNARRRKRTAMNRDNIPVLTKPFSELPNRGGSVPVAEATEFVNRPLELRQMEAQVAGKVKRPLNPFMLYRKAYQGAVKNCRDGEQMNFSVLCAKSWAMESNSVRQLFEELGQVDRLRHEQAFPDYKFCPRRN